MYQTMEGNAAPYQASQDIASATQAELLRTLQTVSDNIMRLAGKLHAGPDAATDDVASITEQHALAQQLIGRLLVMPASQA
ncbi:hypothetical protein AWB79_05782 [Caballeronia hypogeia]|uniref:Uncharacterized protein n=1 Tax=Caballeronia hypogeia TaxID=1777140 RepID=A0A158CQB2_9BURK|nr:hypothetical protein [Caballeronia hypogeia]SAK84508.1 hypothetical protein AWB79_05782 [Caballeronia hypogeia]